MKTKKGIKRNYYPFNHENRLEVKSNKCVLIHKYEMPEEVYKKFPMVHDCHLCGYVAFPIEKVPSELRTMLNPDSYLQFINVPGGITYVEPTMGNQELRKIAKDSMVRKLRSRTDKPNTPEGAQDYLDERLKIMEQYRKDMIDLGADTVVFGFDCGHAGDDDRAEYQDVSFIMKCCEQMEQQLLHLFSRYEELEAAEPEDRAEIIDDIRDTAKIATDPSPISLLFGSSKFRKKR